MRYATAFLRCRTRNAHQCFLVVALLQWRDLDLGRDKIKIMDSRGNAEFDSNVVYDDEDFKSFVYIPEKTPLRAPRHQALLHPNGCSLYAERTVQWLSLAHTELIKEELIKGHPDIVIFVAKAKQLDTLQNKENLLFLNY